VIARRASAALSRAVSAVFLAAAACVVTWFALQARRKAQRPPGPPLRPVRWQPWPAVPESAEVHWQAVADALGDGMPLPGFPQDPPQVPSQFDGCIVKHPRTPRNPGGTGP
jgi:hypothetical protein